MRLRTKYTERLPTAPGLRLDIPMFEGSGTKVLDLSGKGNHGTITDAVWTRDENGVAMSFNGTSAYIDCGNDPSLNITDAITIEVWAKPAAYSYAYIIARSTASSVGIWGLKWRIEAGIPYWRFIWSDDSGTNFPFTKPALDTWHHLVFTYDGNVGTPYVNGEAGTPITVGKTIKSDATKHITIGAHSGPGEYFNGITDRVRIYAVALTAEQIKRRYEQTKRDYVRGS